MILLAAQMACWTSGGASTGAAARPSAWSFATDPATSGVSDGSWAPYSSPPEAAVGWAPPGAAGLGPAGGAEGHNPGRHRVEVGKGPNPPGENPFWGPRG